MAIIKSNDTHGGLALVIPPPNVLALALGGGVEYLHLKALAAKRDDMMCETASIGPRDVRNHSQERRPCPVSKKLGIPPIQTGTLYSMICAF